MTTLSNNNVSEEQINQVAISVTKHLQGKCKFCPRSFEAGEKVVFATMKNIQMSMIEADIEKAEPGGIGEQHIIDIINAHQPCAVTNAHLLRSVVHPRKLI